MPVCRSARVEYQKERTPLGVDPTHAAHPAGVPCIVRRPCGRGGRDAASRGAAVRAWPVATLAWHVAAKACTSCWSIETLDNKRQ